MPQIILGTANFGNEYGVANKGRILSKRESQVILNWAQKNEINHFDTALSYGDSSEILRSNLDHSYNPEVDTKLDEKSCQSSKLVVETAKSILHNLGVTQLSVLYLHREELLQGPLASDISIGLKEVLNLGIAKRIGVSVYSESAVLACKEALPELTVFQVPENICDRRLASSMAIQRMAQDGNSFMVRSIFLQGLLLMEPSLIPQHLKQSSTTINELIIFAENNSLTVMELCLAYANSLSWANGIVVGVGSLNQLMEIQKSSSLLPERWETSISTLPVEILDPRKWTQ
jgi:aryl-alcohol dehydrogenase-like predicted oxidoreductase